MKHFEMLQVAIGVRDGESVAVTPDEWRDFFSFCKRQALLGVGFAAVERIGTCPKDLLFSWFGIVRQIETRNIVMTRACKEVTEWFVKGGFASCILKGQGNLLNYPEQLKNRRQSGDIDIWVSPANNKNVVAQVVDLVGKTNGKTSANNKNVVAQVVDLVRKTNDKARPNYLHTDMVWDGDIDVEVHYRPRFLVSPYRNMLVQRWFRGQKCACMNNETGEGFSVPTTQVNVVYQMTHLFSHYFDEGLGLRQILDYYFLLKTWHKQGQKGEPMETLQQFGIGKFAAAVMWTLQEIFALTDEYLLCPPNPKEGRKLLSEMMQSGNFGQYDQRGKGMKNGGMLKHGVWKLKRIMRLTGSYPEMALCEPWFRLWHYGWKIAHR